MVRIVFPPSHHARARHLSLSCWFDSCVALRTRQQGWVDETRCTPTSVSTPRGTAGHPELPSPWPRRRTQRESVRVRGAGAVRGPVDTGGLGHMAITRAPPPCRGGVRNAPQGLAP